MTSWRILPGDVRETLATLPAASVQCCVTSPPYWGLRDYGHAGQLGLEATPAEYVRNMVEVFAGVWRVLKDDGTLWLNIGDSYASQGGAHGGREDNQTGVGARVLHEAGAGDKAARVPPSGLKPKDLVGIPWMVAFALRDAGWYLRSDIIWHKPNPMPESVTDRPTKAHEHLFLLSKSARYFYDADAIAEVSAGRTDMGRMNRPGRLNEGGAWKTPEPETKSERNKRSVWTVATQPYSGAHFATFPEDLIAPCILAGTSERGQCPACGSPWERVAEREAMVVATSVKGALKHGQGLRTSTSGTMVKPPSSVTTGWQPSCVCNAGDPVPQTVLDPFNGSGTTGAVSVRHQRNYVGCELNQAYIDLARARIGSVAPMFAQESHRG